MSDQHKILAMIIGAFIVFGMIYLAASGVPTGAECDNAQYSASTC